MSKLAFDYSKWDNLDTDDSDAEAPTITPIQEDDTQQKGWRPHADPIRMPTQFERRVATHADRSARTPIRTPTHLQADLLCTQTRSAHRPIASRLGNAPLVSLLLEAGAEVDEAGACQGGRLGQLHHRLVERTGEHGLDQLLGVLCGGGEVEAFHLRVEWAPELGSHKVLTGKTGREDLAWTHTLMKFKTPFVRHIHIYSKSGAQLASARRPTLPPAASSLEHDTWGAAEHATRLLQQLAPLADVELST